MILVELWAPFDVSTLRPMEIDMPKSAANSRSGQLSRAGRVGLNMFHGGEGGSSLYALLGSRNASSDALGPPARLAIVLLLSVILVALVTAVLAG